jgi:hypothetical protein
MWSNIYQMSYMSQFQSNKWWFSVMMMMINLIDDWFWWFDRLHCLSRLHCFPRLKSERFLVGSHLSEPTISYFFLSCSTGDFILYFHIYPAPTYIHLSGHQSKKVEREQWKKKWNSKIHSAGHSCLTNHHHHHHHRPLFSSPACSPAAVSTLLPTPPLNCSRHRLVCLPQVYLCRCWVPRSCCCRPCSPRYRGALEMARVFCCRDVWLVGQAEQVWSLGWRLRRSVWSRSEPVQHVWRQVEVVEVEGLLRWGRLTGPSLATTHQVSCRATNLDSKRVSVIDHLCYLSV